ncbi:uncharacterized protein [Coffea arabica]|uniref:Zinc-finger domain-containing protein n=1 Tax=Coffea arabica TaxID=13443 RepID=A0A6P6TEE4_COFAR|nr:cell division cycle-associated 7-like protein [Coffea arabica]
MVSTRSGGRRTETPKSDGGKQEKGSDFPVKDKPKRKGSSSSPEVQVAVAVDYEEKRAQRMKENMERMKMLGILDLSKNLQKPDKPITHKKLRASPSLPALHDPPRRSSRLKTMTPVNYFENRTPKKDKGMKNVEIHIEKGSNPEVYTKEHEKLLGDSKSAWTLCVDGYDQEGQRIYDPFWGKSCHQCRQKTLGHRTKCSKCKSVSGQFCGDCLYMRYGENVMEVNDNPDWICPVCRGICNCSRCRRVKGWEPTGQIYKKVTQLGFKSVAHYLIQTCRSENKTKGPISRVPVSPDVSLASADKKNEFSDVISMPIPDGNKRDTEDKDRQLHSDDEYMADDSNDDFVNANSE